MEIGLNRKTMLEKALGEVQISLGLTNGSTACPLIFSVLWLVHHRSAKLM